MSDLSTNAAPAPKTEAQRLAEELLPFTFAIDEALATISHLLTPQHRAAIEQNKKRKAQTMAELMALPIDELRRQVANKKAKAAAEQQERIRDRQKRLETKANKNAVETAEREARKFYNLPESTADVKHWAAMDYWTFDDALALLMSIDPRVMTRRAMRNEINPPFDLSHLSEPPTKSPFVLRYEALRAIAERAKPMQPKQLRPMDVVLWAHQSGAIEPPADLVKAILERLKRRQPKPTLESKEETEDTGSKPPQKITSSVDSAPLSNAATIPRKDLVNKYRARWPSLESDLKNSLTNGLGAVAKAARHGHWIEAPALEWADTNNKLQTPCAKSVYGAHNPFGRPR